MSRTEISQSESNLDDDKDGLDGCPDLEEINMDDIAVGGSKNKKGNNADDNKAKAKKAANTASQTRNDKEAENKFDDLLDDAAKEKQEREEKEKEEEQKRGPRIGDDVQVKICDMGNGCWTYHHFTPEI